MTRKPKTLNYPAGGAGAFQHDRRIRLYETDRGWRLRKDVHCRNLRWTVTDTCLSPDQRFLLYASITPTVHMARACSGCLTRPRMPVQQHGALPALRLYHAHRAHGARLSTS